MKFIITKDVPGTTPKGSPIIWLSAGIYDVIRLFNNKRVMIDVTSTRGNRTITIVDLDRGQLVYDKAETKQNL
jgi:hypothetical protein